MKIINYVIIILLSSILFTSCSSGINLKEQAGIKNTFSTIDKNDKTQLKDETTQLKEENSQKENNTIQTKETKKDIAEVKGLTLKYEIFSTIYEMYLINNLKISFRTEASYESKGKFSYDHYKWMAQTYKNFNDEMKKCLKQMYTDASLWNYMNILISKADEITFEEILCEIKNNPTLDQINKLACEKFLPYFYENFFKEYFSSDFERIEALADKMNKQIIANNYDILEFMESVSGIKFKMEYKPKFYYLLDPFSAICLDYGDIKVSTMQGTCTDIKDLFSTPFHEYSHELFRNFTRNSDFINIAEDLKNDKELMYTWKKDTAYDWDGWCEENLVNGFSMYLKHKFFGSTINQMNGYAVYDYDFYLYLKQMNFDGSKDSLKDASINFYKSKLKK